MKPMNVKLLSGIGAAALVAGANLALAESVTIPATVTVNNAINFTSTGTLDFGIVRANADGTDKECVGLVLSTTSLSLTTAASGALFSAACTGAGSAVIQAVGGTVARPVLTVAGVAPFTTLTLKVPNTAQDLAASSTPPGSAKFQIMDFTATKTSGTPASVTISAGSGTFQTDATGGATLTIGASLVTDPGTPTAVTYQDVAYAGTFDVEVNY